MRVRVQGFRVGVQGAGVWVEDGWVRHLVSASSGGALCSTHPARVRVRVRGSERVIE